MRTRWCLLVSDAGTMRAQAKRKKGTPAQNGRVKRTRDPGCSTRGASGAKDQVPLHTLECTEEEAAVVLVAVAVLVAEDDEEAPAEDKEAESMRSLRESLRLTCECDVRPTDISGALAPRVRENHSKRQQDAVQTRICGCTVREAGKSCGTESQMATRWATP